MIERSTFSAVQLIGANLFDVNVSHSNLDRADFSTAHLGDIKFEHSNLDNASFIGATLTDVTFEYISLEGAQFHDAVLIDVSFKNTVGLTPDDFEGACSIDAVGLPAGLALPRC